MRFGRERSAATSVIHVACATNQAYLPHCRAMLRSLLEHEPGPLAIHVFLDRDVADSDREQLRAMIECSRTQVFPLSMPHDSIGDLVQFGPAASWTRMFLADLFPRLDRLIYLDCDVIALKAVRPLWETELGENLLGAVTTVFPSPEWGEIHCAAMGIDNPCLYFNGGVLLLDLARLRAGAYSRRAAAFAEAHPSPSLMHLALHDGIRTAELRGYAKVHPEEALFADQDALNAVLWDKWLALHPRWNCMNQTHLPWAKDIYGGRHVREALDQPSIRHFEGVGSSKPWEPDYELGDRHLYERFALPDRVARKD